MTSLVVVSNRVPDPQRDKPQAGGLAVALLGALQEQGGLWFGWNGQVSQGQVNTPRVEHVDGIDYATLPLAREDYDNYYLGYANKVLWPVFHFNLGALDYCRAYAESYTQVNRLFADALVPLLSGDELLWVNDYHMIPLGRELRERGANQRLGFFLHTPFPSYDLLRALPGHRNILWALCQYDLIGFQTRNDLLAFQGAVVQALDAVVEAPGHLRLDERRVRVEVYPVGIDGGLADVASQARDSAPVQGLVSGLVERDLVIGVDRLDYSKGLLQRFRAFESLLTDYPQRRGQTVFMQIASPSREAIPEYDELRRSLEEMSGHINGTFADLDWMPVHYINQAVARASVMGLYRAARVGLVTPLRDGMNLVAKEYVAAQDPGSPGVLVLSELAGAARELDGAIQINPYDVDAIAAGVNEALAMPLAERRRRHARMMDVLQRNNIVEWRRRFITDLSGCESAASSA